MDNNLSTAIYDFNTRFAPATVAVFAMVWVASAHNNSFIATLRVAVSFYIFAIFIHFSVSKLLPPQGAIRQRLYCAALNFERGSQ